MWRCGDPECDCSGLYQRARDGDQRAASRLVLALTPLVKATVLKVIHQPRSHDIDEVGNATFAKIFTTKSPWSNVGKFCAWVHVIADRAAYDQLRKRGTNQEQSGSSNIGEIIDPRPQSASSEIEFLEINNCIDEKIKQFADHLKITYDLYVIQEKTALEIAEVVGKKERTIRYWVETIRELLRPCFDRDS
jgi:RNA polymerase sigma factor (sigma-70 family)